MGNPEPFRNRWPWVLSAMVHLVLVGLAATLWVSVTPPSRAVPVLKLVSAVPPRPREVVPPHPVRGPAPGASAPATEAPLPSEPTPEPTSALPTTQEAAPPGVGEPSAADGPVADSPAVGPEPDPEPDYLPSSQVTQVPRLPVDELRARLRYPTAARRLGLEATVGLELLIDRTGTIRRIVVVQDPGHGFAEAALKAFEGLRCTPAQAWGEAVAVRFRVPVRFSLDPMR